jgi:hypothetical protein
VRWTLLAAALVGVSLLAAEGRPGAAAPRVELVDGTLSLQNSLDGQAVFSAENIGPGDSAVGSVTVSNAGTVAGALTLSQSASSDTPGPGGAPLSERLDLVVRDATSGSPTTVYSGRLDALGSLALGTLGPGAARVYSFNASLPPSAGEAVAAASMSVSYRWTAETSPPGEPPVPPPVAPPSPPPPADSTTGLREPLRVRVRVPAGQRVAARGWMAAYVRCDRVCWAQGQARLRVGRGRPVRTRKARSGRIRVGREARLVLRVPKRGRRQLRRSPGKRGSISITITGRTATGVCRIVTKRMRMARR